MSPGARAAGRAVCLVYGLTMLPVTVLLLLLLPLIQAVLRRVCGGRPDPWWPAICWIAFVTSLPRLGEAWERRFGSAKPGGAAR